MSGREAGRPVKGLLQRAAVNAASASPPHQSCRLFLLYSIITCISSIDVEFIVLVSSSLRQTVSVDLDLVGMAHLITRDIYLERRVGYVLTVLVDIDEMGARLMRGERDACKQRSNSDWAEPAGGKNEHVCTMAISQMEARGDNSQVVVIESTFNVLALPIKFSAWQMKYYEDISQHPCFQFCSGRMSALDEELSTH